MKCWIIFCLFGLLVSDCLSDDIANGDAEDQQEMYLLLNYAKNECGLNLMAANTEFSPVSGSEVSSSVNAFDSKVSQVIAALENLVSNPSVGNQDIRSLANFLATSVVNVKKSSKGALCAFLKLYLVGKKLEIGAPVNGIQQMGCVDTTNALANLKSAAASGNQPIAAILASDTSQLSTAISSDLNCVLQEVLAYKTYLNGIKSDLGNGEIRVREVLVEIAGLDAWGRLLVRNVGKFFNTLEEVVGIVQSLPSQAASTKLNDLPTTLLKLKDVLSALQKH